MFFYNPQGRKSKNSKKMEEQGKGREKFRGINS
jgi:hypothetical protein